MDAEAHGASAGEFAYSHRAKKGRRMMQGDKPLVSIVTPSLNQAQYIQATIQSVRDQDYSGIEHVVIDGASTDGTLEVLRRYEDRLAWFSEPDQGQADAINKGFSRTRGSI